MSDKDLIRRGDAREAAYCADSAELSLHGVDKIAERIDAIPAATPRPMAEAHRAPRDRHWAIRDAMQDLLMSPAGVVPASAERFYDAKLGRFSSPLVRTHFLPNPEAPDEP